MKIDVTVGEVAIRNVVIRDHGEGILSVSIATPLEKHPVVNMGFTVGSGSVPASTVIDLFRGSGNGRAEFNPSRVVLTPEWSEVTALEGGLFEIDWEKWAVTLICFRPVVFGGGVVVANWERYERGKVEYLGSL